MIRFLFLIGLLFSMLDWKANAQTITRRSPALFLEVDASHSLRSDLVYEGVKWEDANGNYLIDPNEQVRLLFRIRNRSEKYSQSLLISTSLDEPVPGLLLPEVIRLHPIAPGKTIEVSVPLRSSANLQPGLAVVTISIREAEVFEPDQILLNIPVQGSVLSAGTIPR
jgi:hypothetical protein